MFFLCTFVKNSNPKHFMYHIFFLRRQFNNFNTKNYVNTIHIIHVSHVSAVTIWWAPARLLFKVGSLPRFPTPLALRHGPAEAWPEHFGPELGPIPEYLPGKHHCAQVLPLSNAFPPKRESCNSDYLRHFPFSFTLAPFIARVVSYQ